MKNLSFEMIVSILAMAGSVAVFIWNIFQHRHIEKLKRESEKHLFSHRLQFENEFNIYRELWGQLVKLRNIATQLRPEMDTYPEGMSYDEYKQQQLGEAIEIFNSAIQAIERDRPFYAQSIYSELHEITKLARRELLQLQRGDNRNSEYWGEAERNIQSIIQHTDTVCELIRTRIHPG